jgi:hypothetical protein
VLRWHTQIFEFARFDDDVLAFAVLVPLNDLVLAYGGGWSFVGGVYGTLQDLLMPDAFTSASADLMEADLALGLSCNEYVDPEGDK